ncbi:MAG: DNA primase [Flammeovirgaceae bacterium]
MPLSPETIRKVQETADILEVVEGYLTLKKKGANYWALSPFTQEKTPSFSVSPAKGIFKCFSTGKGGNAVSFIMEMEKLSFPEAIKFLAKKYNIEIEEDNSYPEKKEAYQQKESIFIALDFAQKHYEENLKEGEGKNIGYNYLKERGFNDKTIEKFGLGYSLNEWDGLKKTAIKQGFKEEILEKAGLLIRNEEKKSLYDRFRGRVMFPIHNVSGRVIAFGARGLKKEDVPKYLNSPETEVYHKSESLYGIFQAKNVIRQKDLCFLTEGYADVISLHQAGIENVVASSGTSLTEAQIKLIKRFTHNITILYDGDSAGIKAALRGIDLILAADMKVKIVLFPDGEDADSYVRKVGGAVFQSFLEENSKNFIQFKTELYQTEIQKSPQKRAELVEEVVRSISKIPSREERDEYCRICEKILKTSDGDLQERVELLIYKDLYKKKDEEKYEKLLSDIEKKENKGFISEKDVDKLHQGTKAFEDFNDILESIDLDTKSLRLRKQEEEFVRLLILHGYTQIEDGKSLCEYLFNEIAGIEIKTPIYQRIINIYQEEFFKGNLPDEMYFLHYIEEDIKQEAIKLLENRGAVSKYWEKKHKIIVPKKDSSLEKVVITNILRLKYRHIQKLCEESFEMLKNAQTIEEQIEIQKIYMELLQQKKELAKELGIVVA